MRIAQAIETLRQMMDNTDYDDEFDALSMGAEALDIIQKLGEMIKEG